MSESVGIEVHKRVADVRLNRSDKHNALDETMFAAILDVGARLSEDRSIRAVVLSGEGPSFCAGLDLDGFAEMAGDVALEDRLFGKSRSPNGANRAQQLAMLWRDLPMPVIAAVHGAAFGAGLQIALGCDLRIVALDARLSFMEVRWGLVPDMGGIAMVRNLVRDDVARELIWSGREVPGEEAAKIGLATVATHDPKSEAIAWARRFAAHSPSAVRAGKRLMNRAQDASMAQILEQETVEQIALIGGDDQKEAVAANFSKRAPRFLD